MTVRCHQGRFPPPRLAKEGDLLDVLIQDSGRRGAVLIFPELINIAEGGEVF